MENRLRGWSDLAKTTQESEREWTPASPLHEISAKRAVPQHSPCKSCFVPLKDFDGWLVWGMVDLVMCHPNHNCPGFLIQGKRFVIPPHLHVQLYPSTGPNLFKFGLKKAKKIQLFHFLFSAGSLRDVHTFGHLPSQTMPGWWPRLVKKSYTRWAKSPCIWYLLETAQTTKAEGQRFPSWSKTKLSNEFTHHTAMHRHALEIPQNKAWV